MKTVIFTCITLFSFIASASSQTYSGAKARELFLMLSKNPEMVTSGGGGGGTNFTVRMLRFETEKSSLTCTATTTYAVPKNSVAYTCTLENI